MSFTAISHACIGSLQFYCWRVVSPATAQEQTPERPNVIVVMTDDQGYGEFSCHGNPVLKTPHIDQLANAAVRLTDFHVAPMCTPTRGQLMSGLDAFRNGAQNVSSGRTLLRPDLKTMADVFQQAGYRTGMFGKWHLGDNYPFRPQDRGFEETVWFPSSHINAVPDYWDNDYFDDTYFHNGKRKQYSGYCTDVFFNEAIDWIQREEQNDRPFFAYVALNSAHWPWFVPNQYRQPIRDALESQPELFQRLPARPARLESLISFLAMGANIDDNMGRLDQSLKSNGLLENTIVVFLTDNGSTFGPDYFNAGMRGKKTQLWEGGHRVPCFIRWPAKLETREVADLTQVQDLLPTLADLAGIEQVPDNLDGVSLKGLLTGEIDQLEDRMLVINYSRMPSFKVTYTDGNPSIPQRDGAVVLWKQWRLLENKRLYDIQSDPHQDHDVADRHPEIVARLQSHLQTWWDEVEPLVMIPQRVVIGNPADNPTMLTACEWLDVFVDQQVQIRRGSRKNGTWHLHVDQPGTYQFELRRWPREAGFNLPDGCEATEVTDGSYVDGTALPIDAAKLQIKRGSETLFTGTTQPAQGNPSLSFQCELPAGEIELKTYFLNQAGKSICGAYFVYVNRRDEN